ncbi:insulinase family protein [Erythrobacter sp. SCSIO 43205]|nr:insulinase family protein [Erythrobacter sp. SCSIO 43205]
MMGTGVRAENSPAPLNVPPIEYTQWQLDNGLRVVALPDEKSSTVTTSIWYEVGSKHDPDGRAGLSHLVEHIASRKTENMTYNAIYGLTADVGGARNASSWVDRTNYWEQVPAEYLETMLWTQAERMGRLVLDEQVFETERNVVKEEIRQRVLGPPYARLQRNILPENAFDVLPHRRPGIGTLNGLHLVSLDDVRSFYEAYYGPDTATLIVAGNFEIATLRTLVDEHFAPLLPRVNPAPISIPASEPELMAPRVFHARAPNVPVPAIGALWKAPLATHKDAPAIRVAMAILGGGENNRLASALLRTGLATDVTATAPLYREGGYVAIYALARPQLLAATGEELASAIARLRETLVSDNELREAKAEIVAEALERRETSRGRAFEIGEGLAASGDPAFADRLLAEIAKVSARDVRRAARRYFDPRRQIGFTYSIGPDDPALYANPAKTPDFGELPEPQLALRTVKPETTRETPPEPLNRSTTTMPQMVEAQLSNGIRVVAAKTGDVPLVTLSMVMPGGSKTDPAGREGVADLAAALASSGIYDMDAAAIAARFESLGARFDGSADADGTTFTLKVPTAYLNEASNLAARIIKGAIYPSEELDRERARRSQRLAVRDSNPSQLAQDAAVRAIYGLAPYGSGRVGTLDSLSAINRNDLLLHRQRFFHPRRMQLVVSGGIDISEAMPILEAAFGDWRVELGRGAIVEDAAGEPAMARTIVIDIAGADQASVVVALPAPARGAADFDALQLVNAALGGGSSGRLFQEVRTKRSLSYGAYSRIDARKDGSILMAQSQTRNETAGETARIMLEQIEQLSAAGLDEDSLARRRAYLEGTYARVIERSSGFNAVVAGLLLHGLPASHAALFPQKLARENSARVNEAAREYLSAEKTTLVLVGDADVFLDQVRALRGEVEVIPVEALDLSSSTLREADQAPVATSL